MHQITVEDIVVDVVRKKIKNLCIGVYPPDGRVRVSAPLRVNDEAVREWVVTKLRWIRRVQDRFAAREPQPAHEFITGESHYYQGRPYALNVLCRDYPSRVIVRDETIHMFVRDGSDAAQRERVLLEWYRRQLKAQIPCLIQRWEPIIGINVAEFGVKQMKTRWGTCNIKARRIWLNLELAKRSTACLEYIVVHEMVHLLERPHNARFRAHMDRFIPQWRMHREELKRTPLWHAKD